MEALRNNPVETVFPNFLGPLDLDFRCLFDLSPVDAACFSRDSAVCWS